MDADTTAGPPPGERDSRRRLVDAAVELVVEHHRRGIGVREVFAYLTPGAVAERAGLSRALIYHHWDARDDEGEGSFAAFLHEVTARLWEVAFVPSDLGSVAELMPTNPSDLVLGLTDYELDRATTWEGPVVRASQALALYRVMRPGAAQEVARGLGDLYRLLGERIGMEPVPPLDHEAVAIAVSCLFDGFTLQHNVLPDELSRRYDWTPRVAMDGEDPGWTLFAIAVEGVIHHMMRPIAPADGPSDHVSPD